MKIILAEDAAVTRRLLEKTLLDMGHEVIAVADGEAAWSAFERERAPLVILDWLMPELDGLALCRRIRAADYGRDTFVLMETGRDSADDLSAALRAGVDDYLTKPVLPAHLRARVVIAERRIADGVARRRAEAALANTRWLAGIGETALAMQHELNTPLTTLLTEISFAQQGDSPRTQREALNEVRTQAERIADVVMRLAALKEPQSVEPVPGFRMIDLSA
jgi:DNA-binding response OmpR family regulator